MHGMQRLLPMTLAVPFQFEEGQILDLEDILSQIQKFTTLYSLRLRVYDRYKKFLIPMYPSNHYNE